jgi:hypothetical protein
MQKTKQKVRKKGIITIQKEDGQEKKKGNARYEYFPPCYVGGKRMFSFFNKPIL